MVCMCMNEANDVLQKLPIVYPALGTGTITTVDFTSPSEPPNVSIRSVTWAKFRLSKDA